MGSNLKAHLIVLSGALCTPNAKASDVERMRNLEATVWTADESELFRIEHDIVRETQLNPQSALAHLLMSQILLRNFTKDPSDLYTLKQATDLAQQAVDLEPKKDYGFVAMAQILDLMGNSERGLKILEEADKSGVEKSWRFHFIKAKLAADHFDSKQVLETYRQALKLTDSQPRVIIPYVIAVLQSDWHGEQLIKQLDSWNHDFPSYLFDHSAAITYTELGNPKKANDIYAKIIEKNPDNKEAKVNSAILLYRELKNPKRAASIFVDVLERHRKELSESMIGMIHAHLGASYAADKQWEKAQREFLLAFSFDNRNLSILDFMSKAYRDSKAHAQLVSALRQLNDSMSGIGLAHAMLGETLSEHFSQHDAAVRAYMDAITLEPSRSDFYNGMGLAYYRKKSYNQALQSFSAASMVDPTDATARYNHACVLSLLGRTDEAISTLSEALALDPGLVNTAQADLDFANIRGFIKFKELVSAPSTLEIPLTSSTGH